MDTDKRNEINEYAEERYLSSAGALRRLRQMDENQMTIRTVCKGGFMDTIGNASGAGRRVVLGSNVRDAR